MFWLRFTPWRSSYREPREPFDDIFLRRGQESRGYHADGTLVRALARALQRGNLRQRMRHGPSNKRLTHVDYEAEEVRIRQRSLREYFDCIFGLYISHLMALFFIHLFTFD